MLEKGTKIKTVYGNRVTVMEQIGNIVYCYEGIYHITKLMRSTAGQTITLR